MKDRQLAAFVGVWQPLAVLGLRSLVGQGELREVVCSRCTRRVFWKRVSFVRLTMMVDQSLPGAMK